MSAPAVPGSTVAASRTSVPDYVRILVAVAAAALPPPTPLAARQAPGAIPGGCAEPPNRPSNVGCYLSATQRIERLPGEPVFWHLYSYPTRAAAETAKSHPASTVAESLDKIWLFAIADAKWRPATGERVAMIGPLPIRPARQYIARYMEATFPPNQAMVTTVHRHSGPEAWYVVTGAQCLRTPEGITVLRADEGGVVPPGPPMVLGTRYVERWCPSSTTRRSHGRRTRLSGHRQPSVRSRPSS
jgi:mannose-6-phosphate isomerase-like protein (cupin superfamily)